MYTFCCLHLKADERGTLKNDIELPLFEKSCVYFSNTGRHKKHPGDYHILFDIRIFNWLAGGINAPVEDKGIQSFWSILG